MTRCTPLPQAIIARLMKLLTRRGVPVEEMGQTGLAEPAAEGTRRARRGSLRCEEHDRKRLERLCRHITRPAPSDPRVQCNAAMPVAPQFQSRWPDVIPSLVMSPLQFMQRLAALVPTRDCTMR